MEREDLHVIKRNQWLRIRTERDVHRCGVDVQKVDRSRIYVNYAATTPVDPRVFEAMKPYFITKFGNASSITSLGSAAKEALERSREKIAGFMNAEPSELIFTGSATESNNLALKGYAFKKGRKECHIAVTTIEHDCVLNSAKWLQLQGFEITYLPVDRNGLLKMNMLRKAIYEGVTFVSVIHGNNEIGTIQNIEEIGKICKDNDVLFHTDAAQSFGKVPIDVRKMNIDLMTVNSHKLYGPKGVGALYLRKGVEIEPLLHGGGHESGLRSGTVNVPGIVGFAKTVELREKEMIQETRRLRMLRDRLTKGILEIEDTFLNGHPTKRLPNNVNVRFHYVEGEAVVLALDMEGIDASSGSACSSGSEEPSHVLLAIGLKPEEARGSLRLSLGKYNTEQDVTYVLQSLPRIVKKLRAISPLENR